MRLPAIRGIIERRILANYRIDPQVMAAVLPAPFRPQLVKGWAVGGICLIRLAKVRPKFLPVRWGVKSENAAHRIAVEWDHLGTRNYGVYIPRRDTNSRFNFWAGGTLFPGLHHRAQFTVAENHPRFQVSMRGLDDKTDVHVDGKISSQFPESSVFDSLEDASRFFKQGSIGYSDTRTKNRFDGLQLRCDQWQVSSLEINQVRSSYFQDRSRFPQGSVEFDCGLLMQDVDHEWHGQPEICCQHDLSRLLSASGKARSGSGRQSSMFSGNCANSFLINSELI